jgi:hypothetical protein
METEWLGIHATTSLGNFFLHFVAVLYIEMTASEVSGYHNSVSEFYVFGICILWISRLVRDYA